MSDDALPCIVCRKPLRNVVAEAENQPYAGTVFLSHGHYGSTVFDPMDGSYIELNICDECLTTAANDGLVLTGRNTVPVLLVDDRPRPDGYSITRPVHIGSQRIDPPPLIEWRPDLPGDDRKVVLDVDDLYDDDLMTKIDLHGGINLDLLRQWHPPIAVGDVKNEEDLPDDAA